MYKSLLAVFALVFASSVRAAPPAQPQPQLGSPDWTPSRDHPVGWRGDGTGRFPGADPPTQWGRTVKGFYAQLQCLGGKPQGPDKAGELLNMGFLRDWAIIGSFDTRDLKTGIDEEILKDETMLQPGIGDKAGDKAWAHWHISVENQSRSDGKLLLDFAQAFGKTEQQEWQNHPGTMQPWAAYAQTSIWSPVPGKVRLRIEGTSTRKAWLNGQPVAMPAQYAPSPVVDLKQGWNGLVVKCVSTVSGWNFVAHVAPLPPYEYETSNIRWMTRMPGPSWCSPIIVGDHVFVSGNRVWSAFCGQTGISEHGTHCSPALCGDYLIFKTGEMLFSFEKATGKVAWKKRIGNGLGASTLPVPIGNEILAYVPQAGLFRPSDGTLLWKAAVTTDIPTPTIMDGTVYGLGQERYFAFKLPEQVSDAMTVRTLVKTPWKDLEYHMPGTYTDSIIASPLYADGLIYLPSQGGAMNVIEANTGRRVYAHAMDSLNPRLTWVFAVGICSSATLGGNHIYVRDDQGQTLVLAPGAQYKELSKNLLVEYSKEGVQPEAQSNFFFEGRRIYFRTRGFMYCIEGT